MDFEVVLEVLLQSSWLIKSDQQHHYLLLTLFYEVGVSYEAHTDLFIQDIVDDSRKVHRLQPI